MEVAEAYSIWLLLIFGTVLTFVLCSGLLIGIGYFVLSAIDDYKERKTKLKEQTISGASMLHIITPGKLPPPPPKKD